MLLNKTDAAKVAGVSRRSFYNHIPKKKISITNDIDGEEKVDVSELKRVYGAERVALNLKKFMDEQEGVQPREVEAVLHVQPQKSENHELEVLRERMNHFEEYKIERKREREQLEDRIDQLSVTLEKALENQNKTTLLLEHYTKEGGDDDWKTSLKSLEERIANQEKTAIAKAEQEAKYREKAQKKIEEQATEIKEKEEALELEKKKSFLHKLLGK